MKRIGKNPRNISVVVPNGVYHKLKDIARRMSLKSKRDITLSTLVRNAIRYTYEIGVRDLEKLGEDSEG